MSYRVLHLITHLGVGGAQDYMLHAVQGLDRARYVVDIAAGTDELEWEDRARAAARVFHPIPALRRPLKPAEDARALRQLVALMRRERYDVVHTHSSKAGALGRLAAALAGVPAIVHTVHGFAWFQYHMPPRTQRFYKAVEAVSALYSSRVLTVCESNARDLVRGRLVPARKITTIYNGIDSTLLETTVDRVGKCCELGLDPARPIVGMIGRLADPKAPLDFVEAARLAGLERPDAQFVIVGDGPLRPAVDAAIAAGAPVRVLGMRADVPAILPLLDVFAASSIWEGLSRAVAEALLARRPVAATAVHGTPELVIDGVTGLLSPARRPDLLAGSILRLLNDPSLAARLAAQGQAHARQLCSVMGMVQQIESVYESALQQKLATRYKAENAEA